MKSNLIKILINRILLIGMIAVIPAKVELLADEHALPPVAGRHDVSYVPEYKYTGQMHPLEDGGMLVVAWNRISRFDTEGNRVAHRSLVPSILNPARFSINETILDGEGRLVIAGHAESTNTAGNQRIWRVDVETLANDTSFPMISGFDSVVTNIAELPGKGYLLTGQFSTFADTEMPRLALVDYDGVPQPDFARDVLGPGFTVTPQRIAVAPDGTIFISGQFHGTSPETGNYMLVIDSEGNWIDSAPPFTSTVESLFTLSDGSCIVVHRQSAPGYGIALLRPDGSNDDNFAAEGSFLSGVGNYTGAVHSVAEQPDGKIVVVGSFVQFGDVPVAGHIRLLRDGSIDPEYAASTGFTPGSILTPAAYPRNVVAVGNYLYFTANASDVWFQGDQNNPGPVRVFGILEVSPFAQLLGQGTVAEGAAVYYSPTFGRVHDLGSGWAFSEALNRYVFFPPESPAIDGENGFWFAILEEEGLGGLLWHYSHSDWWTPYDNDKRSAFLLSRGLESTGLVPVYLRAQDSALVRFRGSR